MKSYVILFCVLVYCSKIVESNPLYTEDVVVQRASKNYDLTDNNKRRVYENEEFTRPQDIAPRAYQYEAQNENPSYQTRVYENENIARSINVNPSYVSRVYENEENVRSQNVAPRVYENVVRSQNFAPRAYETEEIVRTPNVAQRAYETEEIVRSQNVAPRAYETEEFVRTQNVAARQYETEETVRSQNIAPRTYETEEIMRTQNIAPRVYENEGVVRAINENPSYPPRVYVNENIVRSQNVAPKAYETDEIVRSQDIAPRVYDNEEIVQPQNGIPSNAYRQSTSPQYRQQWQNNGNYRYNQFKPGQPGKFITRNGFYNKNWVYPNRPVKVVPPAPTALSSSNDDTLLTTAEAYASSIQNQREWVNNVEYIPPVKPQYQRPIFENPTVVFQKPAIEGSSLIQPQFVVPANNEPLDVAPARNPTQNIIQIEDSTNNLPPNLQTLIKSPQVQNVLAANENRRGFLIIHPNGTLEQLDEINEVHKSHPNYIMMNVGDGTPNQNSILVFSPTPVPVTTVKIDPAPTQVTPRPSPVIGPNAFTSSPGVTIPYPTNATRSFGYPQWNKLNYRPYYPPRGGPSSLPTIRPHYNWPGYKYTGPNFYTTPVVPILPALNPSPSVSPIPDVATTPTPEDADETPNENDDDDDDDETIIDDDTESTVNIEDAPVTSSPDESGKDSTTPAVPSPTTIAPPSDDTTDPSDSGVTVAPQISKTIKNELTTQSPVALDIVTGPPTNVIKSAVPSELTTPAPDLVLATTPAGSEDTATATAIVNIPVTTTPTTDGTNSNDTITPDNDDESDNYDDEDDSEVIDDGDERITLSPIENPGDTSNGPDSAVTSSTPAVPETDLVTTTYEKSIDIIEESVVESPCSSATKEVPAGLVNLKTTTKPAAWFKTTNSEFWDKLTKGNDYDVIYFMQMHPQPIIQKDAKTMVFPNGTVYEELTETQWDSKEDKEPKVTKSIKITHKQ